MFRRAIKRLGVPLAVCIGLLLALPLVAAAAPQYELLTGWPLSNNHAADYGYIDVTGVAVGRDGRVYICQGKPSHHKVLVFTSDGSYVGTWATGTILDEPHTIRLGPDGNLWLTDFNTHIVTRFSPQGQFLGSLGVRHKPRRTPGHFSGPNDIAFSPFGDIYVAEGDGNDVVHLDSSGNYLQRWGRKGKRPGQFRFPHSIAVDGQGRVYVVDRNNHRIQIFTRNGQFLTQWKFHGVPYSIWITPDQEVFISDGANGTISIFDIHGTLQERFGKSGRGPGRLDEPHMICVDRNGAVYIADAGGKKVAKAVPQ